jgi:hypothetical protein
MLLLAPTLRYTIPRHARFSPPTLPHLPWFLSLPCLFHLLHREEHTLPLGLIPGKGALEAQGHLLKQVWGHPLPLVQEADKVEVADREVVPMVGNPA